MPGYPARRVETQPVFTRNSPTGAVSGLCELSFERPLSTTNITADQGNFFSNLFQLPARARTCSLPESHLLH